MFSVYLKRDFRSVACFSFPSELTVDSIMLTTPKLENEKKRGGRSERERGKIDTNIKSNIKPHFRDL